MTSSGSNNIDVLLVGNQTRVDGDMVNLIERAGGNVKVVQMVDHLFTEYLYSLTSYDLIILATTVENGIQATRNLRDDYMKAMIVAVSADGYTDEEESELKEAGVDCLMVTPLTDEKMETVFSQLKIGMDNGSYRKQFFKALIVDDTRNASFRSHHDKLIRKAGGLATTSALTLRECQLEIPYDLILVSKASMVKKLSDKGLDKSMMVGVVTSSYEEQRQAFLETGVTNIFRAPLTMEDLIPLISHLMN